MYKQDFMILNDKNNNFLDMVIFNHLYLDKIHQKFLFEKKRSLLTTLIINISLLNLIF